MKISINKTNEKAIPNGQSESPTLIRPAYFENKLVKPAYFADKSTGSSTSSNTEDSFMPAPMSPSPVNIVPHADYTIRKTLLFSPLNDAGNVDRFFAFHGDIIRYACNLNQFYIWNGRFWQADEKKSVKMLCEVTMRAYLCEAVSMDPNEGSRMNAILHSSNSCNAGKINSLVTMLQHHCAVDSRDFDAQPYLLNVRNGVVNLQTGQLLPHDKTLLLSKYIDVNYYPERTQNPSVFGGFLQSISCNNPTFISDLQMIFGYGITEETREQVLFLLHGTGSNGKTTLLEAIRSVVATFVKTFPIEQLTSSDSSNGTKPNPALVAASDARILFTSESNEKDSLTEGKVKSLTGCGTLTTRDNYKGNFEFVPKFKIFVDTNFLPKIKGLDFAIWRRIRLLKFRATFTPDTVDVKLPEKLRTPYEQECILSWLIAGAIKYYNWGLILSNNVLLATAEYQNDCDTVGRFLNECVEKQEGSSCGANELYTHYKNFCDVLGLDALTSTMFGRIVTIRGVEKREFPLEKFISTSA